MTEIVEVPKSEIKVMNNLILSLIDASLFVQWVHNDIEEAVENSPENFITEGKAYITESDIDNTIEKRFESEFGTADIPTIVYEYVYENLDNEKFDEWKHLLEEIAKEGEAFHKDPLGYHGLSVQKDFL